ncbi:MAG: lipopolysaccharide heptosyltransferase I [Formosimonas sp.]
MKILLVKMSSMGDVVHAMPVLHDILRQHPTAQIDWVVEAGFADLVRANAPRINRVLPIRLRAWRKSWFAAPTRAARRAFKAELQAVAYDLIIDCQGLLKSAWVARTARLAAGGRRVGFDFKSAREPLASGFYGQTFRVSRQWPAVQRNRALCAAALGYTLDGSPHVDFSALDDLAAPRADWVVPREPFVVLIPNASRASKRWAHWAAVAAQCAAANVRTVWFWAGEDELNYTESLLAQLPPAVRAQADVPPFLSIVQAAQCLRKARCVVGLDSGLTHLAAALGKPTLGIYCDHDPALAPMTAHTQDASQVASLGGVAQPPSLESVQSILAAWLRT